MLLLRRLQSLLDYGKLASVEPDHSNMEGGVLVHQAKRLQDVLNLFLRMRLSIPISVGTAKLHVPVEHTYHRPSIIYEWAGKKFVKKRSD